MTIRSQESTISDEVEFDIFGIGLFYEPIYTPCQQVK